jgi:hypothetical protein
MKRLLQHFQGSAGVPPAVFGVSPNTLSFILDWGARPSRSLGGASRAALPLSFHIMSLLSKLSATNET